MQTRTLMRAIAIVIAPLLTAQSPEIPEVEGKTLPSVTGPMTERSPDPARGIGRPGLDDRIRQQARRSVSIPAVAVPKAPIAVLDRIQDPAGWRAYRVEVPAKATIHARLTSVHEAWFRVRTVNRWGQLEQGMLQNRIATGNPEASFINPKSEAATVYFVVDTTETSMEGEPFKLTFRPR